MSARYTQKGATTLPTRHIILPLPTARVLQRVDDGTRAEAEMTRCVSSWACFRTRLSSPDDGWVELTGVKVDETEGDGDGKLPRHGQSDGQGVDVLQKGQRKVLI